jgi:hypothetical protein
MMDEGLTFWTEKDKASFPEVSTAKIIVFSRPVSNTKNQEKYSWPGLFELLTGE